MCRMLLALVLMMVNIAWAAGPDPENRLILGAEVNGVVRGDVLAIIENDNPDVVWISESDFKRFEIAQNGLGSVTLDGTAFIRINNADVLQFSIDWNELKILITASPELLGTRLYSFSNTEPVDVSAAPASSGYLNYDLFRLESPGSNSIIDAAANLNLSVNNWVFRSDYQFTSIPGEGLQRRNTSLFHDWTDRKLRLTVGDTYGQAGLTGRGGSIAGLRLEKLFHFETDDRSPRAGLVGTVSTPSVAEIYVDDTLIRTVDLAPGRFEFEDIWYYGGMRRIDVKITDAAGNIQTLSTPYYFSESSLKAGVQEYSYAAGLRSNGGESDRYRGYQLTGQHRYGLTSALTLGIYGEWADDYRSAGVESLWRTRYGLAGVNLAASHTPGRSTGQALRLSHGWSGSTLSLASSLTVQSRDFLPPAARDAVSLFGKKPAVQFNSGISTALDHDQSVSLELAWTRYTDHDTGRFAGIRYNKSLGRSVNLGLSLAQRNEQGRTGLEGSLTLSVALDDNWNSTSRVERQVDGRRDLSVTLDRSVTPGKGTGVRMDVDHNPQSSSGELNLQHSLRSGSWFFSGRHARTDSGKRTAFRVGTSGAFALSDGHLYAARTIGDSFAVVRTGELAGVGVFHNNQFVGKTGKDGTLLVPNTGDYMSNQIRIDDRDIPMEYKLNRISQTVVPPTGIGVPVSFEITPMAAVAGQLVGNDRQGQYGPVRLASLQLVGEGATYETTSGPDGDFYLEDIRPGHYTLTATSIYHECRTEIQFGDKDLPFADLGELSCENTM